jgi:hypothetical protein
LKRNFYKDERRHTKEQERGGKKRIKVKRERDDMTAVDEKGKGKAEMMKQGRNKSLFLSPLILNCIHAI